MTGPAARAAERTSPFDVDEALRTRDWRQSVTWPLALARASRLAEARLLGLVELIRQLPDSELRDIVALAGVGVLMRAIPLGEAAAVLIAASHAGTEVRGSPPELSYLRGESPEDVSFASRMPASSAVSWPRRARWTIPWNAWSQIPRALVAPRSSILTQNELLLEAVRAVPLPSEYLPAEHIFAQRAVNGSGGATAEQAAQILTSALTADEGLDAETRDRLRKLVGAYALEQCGAAAWDLRGLRKVKRLPSRGLAATGSKWQVRAVSIEIMRRGGQITRFDHGGGRGLHLFPAWPAVLDLYVSTRFALATPALASRLKTQGVHQLMPSDRDCVLLGMNGDPSIRRRQVKRTRVAPLRRKVVYAGGQLRGFRQTVPAQLPDVLYLDWQFRLAEALGTLPISYVYCPHPGGLRPGRTHPLAGTSAISSDRFEELMNDADVFLLDQPHSTTFYEAVCTDRPVVLIDFGAPYFDSVAAAMVERRCRRVPVHYDERNRAFVESSELKDAICGGSASADPSEFRALLAGDGSGRSARHYDEFFGPLAGPQQRFQA